MAKKAKTRVTELKPPSASAVAGAGHPPVGSLDDILGQERAKLTLGRAIQSGRVHHAWIFHGPTGVGKFTTALAFAGLLLTPRSAAEAATSERAARLLAAGAHPDLQIVTKELAKASSERDIRDRKQRTIPKEVLREFLLVPASRTRQIAGDSLASKVFIIDEADLLDNGGQDVMLKMLEEPPAGTVFLLVTAGEQDLRATIRSRCQRVGFARLGDEDMRRWADGLEGVEPVAREKAMAFAGGSPGLALMALETGLSEWPDALRPGLDQAAVGRFPLELGATAAKLVEQWAEAFEAKHPNASKEAANRTAVSFVLEIIGDHIRQLLRTRSAGTEPAAAGRAGGAGLAAAAEAVELLVTAERQVESNVSPALVFEALAAGLTELGSRSAGVAQSVR